MLKRSRHFNHEIAPDEIFLDSRNSPEFDTQQFEGRLERPISRSVIFILGGFFFLALLVFLGRVFFLQVVEGESFKQKSENNRLLEIPIFGDRGVIYDRNQVELAWNKGSKEQNTFYFDERGAPRKCIHFQGVRTTSKHCTQLYSRAYKNIPGLANIVGYVSHPRADESGNYWQKEIFGRDGIENSYNEFLKGENGSKLMEINATGEVVSEGITLPPKNGQNLTLSIDSRIQEKFYELIYLLADQIGFKSGAGIIMDVKNGEILAIVSYPGYDSNLLSDGGNTKAINALISDNRKPFLNRAVSGLYTPGSIVKPYLAIGALAEGIITPWKEILSTGSISIQNPYFPDKKSVFNDWKAHGLVDMRRAIAVSSDVYFYEIGGGYQDQPGLGIEKIEKYVRLFGLGAETGIDLPGEVDGVIPNPDWKAENFNGEKWFLGNTYHTAIGQYGFQVTPIQVARAVAAIANGGELLTPHLATSLSPTERKIDINKNFFNIVREGMRLGVTEGTAKGLDMWGVNIAAKTGTAELGISKELVNSWVTGFFPYENPRYAFAVVMERGPRGNTLGGLYVMRELLDWMVENTPEYLK